MRMALMGICIALLAVACDDDSQSSPRLSDATAIATSSPAGPTVKPFASATPRPNDTFALGETAETTAGFAFTVIGFEPSVVSDNQFKTPDPGNQFVAIEVQECSATTSSETYTSNPFHFELQMADNTRRQSDIAVREPALHATNVAAGDCVRGFVTFQVPIGQKPRFALFSLGELVIKWIIP